MSAPLWGNQAVGGGFSGGSGGFSNPWGSRGGGNAGGNAGESSPVLPGADSGSTPGTYDVNPLDPAATAFSAQTETANLFEGLKNALFGTSQADPEGKHGGIIGDIPIAGDLTRAASETIGNAGGVVASIPGHAADLVGGALEHVDLSQGGEQKALQQKFDAISDDSPAKQEALKAIANDPGAAGHYMSAAVRGNQEELGFARPDLYAGMFTQPGSAADTVTNIFDILGWAQRGSERLIAGTDRAGGTNRLEETMLRAGGATATGLFSGNAELSPVEALVAQKFGSGEWTETQALDFLASHGAGLSHDTGLQIAGTFATDPLNVATLGAGALAKVGATGIQLAAKAEDAVSALRAAEKLGDAAKIAEATEDLTRAMGAMRATGTSAKANVLGKIAETEKGTELVRLISAPQVSIAGTSLGKAAKIVRTVIDPLHALDLHMPGKAGELDVMSDAAPKALAEAYGPVNHVSLLNRLGDLVPDRALFNMFTEDFGRHSARGLKRIIGENHRAMILLGEEGAAKSLIETLPGTIIDDLAKHAPKGIVGDLMGEFQQFRIREFDEVAKANLARRLAKLYKHLDEDAWAEQFKTLNPDQLSMLHLATFERAGALLAEARPKMSLAGKLGDKVGRITLLNKTTLTRIGAEGIIDRITGAKTLDEAVAELKAAQTQYPDLRYLKHDPTAPQRSVDRFVAALTRRLDSLPMQLTADEVAAGGDEVTDLVDSIDGAFTLGFRPEDEFLWGLERSNEAAGGYAPVGDIWLEDLIEAPNWRPARGVTANIVGKPIIGAAAGKALRGLDYVEAMGRVMKTRVSGAVIAEAARAKFVARTVKDYGATESEAHAIFRGLEDLVSAQDIVVNPRGLTPVNMWHGVEKLVPPRMVAEGFKRDLLRVVLDAYDGDVRFIGLTQKFTGRVKAMLGPMTGNAPAILAENLYPTIKFRLSPIFQVQERLEPIILNAQRGASVSVGRKLNDADRATQALLDRMTESSMIRTADMTDMAEFSSKAMIGTDITRLGTNPTTAVGRIRAAGGALGDVKGAKRVNMLRTFRKGLGKELRKVWETNEPGVWDNMKMEAQRKVVGLLDDDDFAVQIMAEHMLGNDILVRRIEGVATKFAKAEFKAAIEPGTWALPQHLGELRPLGLDNMAELMELPMPRGAVTKTQADLRAGIASGDIKLETISDMLRYHGADPDYVRRVENALNFSWTGFWDEAAKRYGLTRAESGQLQDMVAGSASARDMTPIDYISQVFSPTIRNGQEGAIGELGKAVEVMRGGKAVDVSQLAELTAHEGAGREDLVRQLAGVFSAHLDPSAKRALLLEFRPELRKGVLSGELQLDLNDLDKMWDAGADDDLAKQIMGYMDSTEGDYWASDVARTAEEYDAAFPMAKSFFLKNVNTGARVNKVTQTLGKGLQNAEPELRGRLIQATANVQKQVPEVRLAHVDILPWEDLMKYDEAADAGTMGMTIGTPDDRAAFILSEDYFGSNWRGVWEDVANRNEAARTKTHFAGEQRVSDIGAPHAVGATPESVIYHEAGHALQEFMDAASPVGGKAAKKPANVQRFQEFNDWADTFEGSPAAFALSEYATEGGQEAMAELMALALDPHADLAQFSDVAGPGIAKATFHDPDMPVFDEGPETVQEAVDQLRDILERNGIWKRPPPASANPDVVRANRMFGKWSEAAINQGLLRGSKSQFAGILNDIARIPTEGASAYNLTEARLVQGAQDAMKAKFEDAHRLQYFNRSRTMLERSINHPMFGIYPASYMWGKMLPEVVRFISKEPFGVRTGAAAYSLMDIQRAVAIQREFDPEFDAHIEKLGHSQAMWMLGYMLPAVPWDVSAAFPAWLRDIGQQGLDNEAAVEAGGAAEGVDVMHAAQKAADTINPLRSIKQVQSVTDELFEEQPEPEAAPTPQYGQPGYGQSSILSQSPVEGVNLGPTLEQQMQQLRDVLGS